MFVPLPFFVDFHFISSCVAQMKSILITLLLRNPCVRMMHLSTFAATILYSVQVVVPVLASRHGFTTLDSFWKRDIATTLASKLSANASIVLPSDPDWSTVADRWTQYLAPSFSLVVEPATEADIVAAVILIIWTLGPPLIQL